jgi:hypothetical protein
MSRPLGALVFVVSVGAFPLQWARGLERICANRSSIDSRSIDRPTIEVRWRRAS